MYVEKKTISTYVFRRGHRSLDEFGGARKLAALSSIGPPNDRGGEIRTILNKLAFLLGSQAVSGIKD